MSSLTVNSVLSVCKYILKTYQDLLIHHLYISKHLISIQKKLVDSERENHNQLKEKEKLLKVIEQRLEALRTDPHLDKLLRLAKSEQQVEEIFSYIQDWGIGKPVQPFDSPAHCIIWHANEHGDGDLIKYLRKANNFNKRGAKKRLVDGAKRWTRKNGEFLIERDGKIVSYGKNVFRFRARVGP